ncbi:hypothetical protein [Bosea sp. 2RAB26]|uniref:hypothetical protein n=1 Tax=Bosea sp. 2RAB26 TaxID=3237476 RepID=UPI003F936065
MPFAASSSARVRYQGFVLQFRRLGLSKRGLVRRRVDLDEHVPCTHVLAFVKTELLDLPIDAAGQIHAVERDNGSQPCQEDRHIGTTGVSGDDGY